MRHIIVTRLGIGVCKPSFYSHQISLMEHMMFRSMVAQTSTSFEWVIAVDEHIDSASLARLQALLQPYKHFRVVKCSPTKQLTMYPSLMDVISGESGSNNRVLISRTDADDALSTRFVEDLQHQASLTSGLCVFAFQRGAEANINSNLIGPVHHKSIAIGISVISDAENPVNIYGKNHRKLDQWVHEQGGMFVPIDHPGIAYLHLRHAHSDSHSGRTKLPRSSKTQEPIRVRKFGPFAWSYGEYYRRVCKATGLHTSWADAILKIRIEETSPLMENSLPRLATKDTLLKLLAEARAANDPRRAKALINAFYAL